jgi:hypothetical protein
MAPSSSTAAAVIALPMLPGSKTSLTARLPRTASAALPGSPASKVGTVASASTSPVVMSISVALALSASLAATVVASTCWAYHCRSRSSVSCTSRPGLGSVTEVKPFGMTRPPPSTSAVRLPSRPDSTSSKRASIPAVPLPSTVVKPMTLAASSPPGATRRGSAMVPTPTRPSARTFAAWSGSRPRAR